MEDTETSSTSTSTSSAGAGASRVGKVESFFTTEEFDDALALMDSQPQQSAKVFASILAQVDGNEESTAKTSRMKEEAIYMLGKIFAKANDVPRVKQLMVDIRPFFATISKPRSAKIGMYWFHLSFFVPYYWCLYELSFGYLLYWMYSMILWTV